MVRATRCVLLARNSAAVTSIIGWATLPLCQACTESIVTTNISITTMITGAMTIAIMGTSIPMGTLVR